MPMDFTFTKRSGLLGFLLALSALGMAAAATAPPAAALEAAGPLSGWTAPAPGELGAAADQGPGAIEARLRRISAAIRERETAGDTGVGQSGNLVAYGFANGRGGGGFANGRYGGAAVGPGGARFANGHPYYGGASRGFVNGGGGFVNGGGGFVNAANAGFVNGAYRGGAFRNW